ncbi:Dynein heavy chain 7, axonemal [Amphibalanus amphitrite]|uniref:Dynein heavy chain 7, axonemal n=1 Tax=Amphibalanus amphitrite TaxID=1232801 RepID=A0A6A4WHA2_AMPAM|nr:Dynein heavy chain 7, axonemal [Amphibalanus amphitrite]
MRGSKRRPSIKPTGGGSPCVKKPHYNAPIPHKREEFAPHSNLPKDVNDQTSQFVPEMSLRREQPPWLQEPPVFTPFARYGSDRSQPPATEPLFRLPATGPGRRRGAVPPHIAERCVIKRNKFTRPAKKVATQSYLQCRVDREQFRRRLVELLTSNDDDTLTSGPASRTGSVTELPVPLSESSSADPSAQERALLRYYYYIHNGIETGQVAPMADQWLQHMDSMLAAKLRSRAEPLEKLHIELTEEYLFGVKKAVVDYILTERPGQDYAEPPPTLPHRLELRVTPSPWRHSFLHHRRLIFFNLWSINTCLLQILDLWYKQFSELRLLDSSELYSAEPALELSEFNHLLEEHIARTMEALEHDWFPAVHHILMQGAKRNMMPSLSQPDKLETFFNAVATLMSMNVQNLLLHTIWEYTDMLCSSKSRGFVLHLVRSGGELHFQPTVDEFEEQLLAVFERIIAAVQKLKRAETRVFLDWPGRAQYLKPVVLPEIVESLKQRVRAVVAEQSVGPKEHALWYERYEYLISGQANADVEEFLSGQHPFEEYQEQVVRYHELSYEINCESAKVIRLGMFELRCDTLTEDLVSLATGLRDKILHNMLANHNATNKTLSEEYEQITDKSLTVPSNTAQLMELKEYVDQTESVRIPQMEDQLRTIFSHLLFLSDYAEFSSADLRHNTETFLWHQRIPAVFDEGRSIYRQKRVEFEEALKVRRERFLEELETYNKQVEELEELGELPELPRYLKRAQGLEEKLQQALDKTTAINDEEEAFEWEVTNYPRRKEVADKLNPYLRLYTNGVEFSVKYDSWMSAPVKSAIDGFRAHLPEVQTLGNPGLRDRHWEKISEIVGFPIKADSETTLAKIIDLNLTDYISKFESISESATKEYNLERAMDKMRAEWKDMEFNIVPYRESGTSILSSLDEIQLMLDDHLVKTQTMRGSPFIKPFEEQICEWEKTLTNLQEILDEWLKVQITWLYLEPIFSSPDIMSQMPEEGRRFTYRR